MLVHEVALMPELYSRTSHAMIDKGNGLLPTPRKNLWGHLVVMEESHQFTRHSAGRAEQQVAAVSMLYELKSLCLQYSRLKIPARDDIEAKTPSFDAERSGHSSWNHARLRVELQDEGPSATCVQPAFQGLGRWNVVLQIHFIGHS